MLCFRRSRFLVVGLLAALAGGAVALGLHARRADHLLARGQDALARGDWREAERLAATLEEKGSRAPMHLLRGEAWLYTARAALERDGPEVVSEAAGETRARAAFRRALGELSRIRDDGPLAAEGTVRGAECLVYLGERRLAAEALEAVVKRQPEYTEAHRWLAAIYIDLNSPAEAIEHLKAWARLDPNAGRPCRWIGFYYKDYGVKPGEAIEAYRQALQRELTPADRAAVLQELAEVLITPRGDYQEALDVLAQLPEANRDRPEILVRRSECLWGLGRPEEAVALADRAVREGPDVLAGLLWRAKLLLNRAQPRPALPLLEKATRLDPHDVESRQYLMLAYQQARDTARAEEQRQLLEAATRDKHRLTELHQQAVARPWDDQVRLELAELCLKVNRPDEARTWLRAALACNPENPRARQLWERVQAEGGRPLHASSRL